MKFTAITISSALLAAGCLMTGPAQAQQAPKPEQLIKWRQASYQVIAWNTSRIKANLDGSYSKEDVVKSANVIAALANEGLGSLFIAGTETGKGFHETAAKPELFKDGQHASELAASFTKEANELLRVAQSSDAGAVKAQFAQLTRTCKSCHDDFRSKD